MFFSISASVAATRNGFAIQFSLNNVLHYSTFKLRFCLDALHTIVYRIVFVSFYRYQMNVFVGHGMMSQKTKADGSHDVNHNNRNSSSASATYVTDLLCLWNCYDTSLQHIVIRCCFANE